MGYSNWHVKPDSTLGGCRAVLRPCPFAAEGAVHFTEEAAARTYAAALAKDLAGGTFASARLKREQLQDGEELAEARELEAFDPREASAEELEERLVLLGDQSRDLASQKRALRDKLKVGFLQDEAALRLTLASVEERLRALRQEQVQLRQDQEQRLMGSLRREYFPPAEESLNPTDPDSYITSVSAYAYFGDHMTSGERFTYQGEVYTAESWEWDRAALVTTFEATNLRGHPVTLEIPQGEEDEVKLWPKGGQAVRHGSYYLLDEATGASFEASFDTQVAKLSPEDREALRDGTHPGAYLYEDLDSTTEAAAGRFAVDPASGRSIPLERLVAVPANRVSLEEDDDPQEKLFNAKLAGGFKLFE